MFYKNYPHDSILRTMSTLLMLLNLIWRIDFYLT